MKFQEIVINISREFTHAWNVWDLEKRISFLAQDAQMKCPNIGRLDPCNLNNTIMGKDNIAAYWSRMGDKKGPYEIVQRSIKKVDTQVIALHNVYTTDIEFKEIFRMNEYGKIIQLVYEYNDDLMEIISKSRLGFI